MNALRQTCLGLCFVICAVAVACGPADRAGQPPRADINVNRSKATTAGSSSGTRSVAGNRPRVVFLGDSLTAGLGLSPQDSYPMLVRQRIEAEGLDFEVVNAGVSGDTSAGGLSRLDWAFEGDVSVLVLALGANDGLRGLPVEELRRNLTAIIERARARNIRVVLAGMEAPPNFGPAYTVSFHEVYPDLAKKYQLPFVPFLLQDVAGVDLLNQGDGIHPTAEGARRVADNVWTVLRPVLTAS